MTILDTLYRETPWRRHPPPLAGQAAGLPARGGAGPHGEDPEAYGGRGRAVPGTEFISFTLSLSA